MHKGWREWSIWIVSSIFLSACANPTSSIEPDSKRFERNYPSQIVTLSTGDRPIRFAWSGDPKKRPIVFVHGSPGSWQAWSHFLLDADLQKHFQLIAVDRPGYGGSGEGMSEPSLEKQAADILAVLQINDAKIPAIFVGHSFGGPVIARIAMDDPEKVAGLVFVASSVSPNLEKTKWFQYPASWWPIRALIPNPLRVCNEEIFALKGELIKMLPKWRELIAPSILIQGEEDDLVPPENIDFLLAHLQPKFVIEAVRVPGLNHFIPWKRPDLIFDAIEKLSPYGRQNF